MASRRRAGYAAVLATAALATAALLSGCTGSDSKGTSATGTASGSPAARASAVPSGNASSYPVPPSASPSPLPALASASNNEWTMSLTAVRRAGPGEIVVEGVLTPRQLSVFTEFTEQGFAYRKPTGTGNATTIATREFSAVRLAVPGDPTIYLPMRDAAGACACTEVSSSGVGPGQAQGVYVYMTAPQTATSVDVFVKGFATFRNVSVSG